MLCVVLTEILFVLYFFCLLNEETTIQPHTPTTFLLHSKNCKWLAGYFCIKMTYIYFQEAFRYFSSWAHDKMIFHTTKSKVPLKATEQNSIQNSLRWSSFDDFLKINVVLINRKRGPISTFYLQPINSWRFNDVFFYVNLFCSTIHQTNTSILILVVIIRMERWCLARVYELCFCKKYIIRKYSQLTSKHLNYAYPSLCLSRHIWIHKLQWMIYFMKLLRKRKKKYFDWIFWGQTRNGMKEMVMIMHYCLLCMCLDVFVSFQ